MRVDRTAAGSGRVHFVGIPSLRPRRPASDAPYTSNLDFSSSIYLKMHVLTTPVGNWRQSTPGRCVH